MCGIAGVLRYPGSVDERRSIVTRMGDVIRHRGPDDSGSFVDGDVALNMQRLSIVDLAHGHQPMATGDGGLQIVYNGEIYNHRALRDDLAARGERFETAADTEVLLKQYARFGVAGFHALNGMFAAAFWDTRARRLCLVRDRMGVKPLYYYWDGKVFAFASEIKALLSVPAVEKSIEPCALWDYLTFRYVPGPRTAWRHISKVQPGYHVTIDAAGGAPVVTRWWSLPDAAATPARDERAMVEEFGALFEDAVRLRMIADVPVGVMLSGGIDSSAVAAVAAATHPRLKTFSVSFADSPATDERAYARAVAAHLGTEHAEVEIGQREFMDFLPSFVHYTDEPLADLASVPLYYVSKLAAETVKVTLSGEGADEILAGYDFDRWWQARRDAGARDLRGDTVPPHMTNYLDSAAKRALMPGVECRDSADVLRARVADGGDRHPLDQMLYLYCQDWLVEDLLMKADRMSMANSIELRTPFLDYRLVEWAARAPLAAKLGPNRDGRLTTKHVLRQFAEGRLPREILVRPKQGFPVPVYGWLSTVLKDVAFDLVLGPHAKLHRWLERSALEPYVDRGVAADAETHDRHRLWHLMILEYWLRAWRA
jgi:asparagine synthase (glutamine-hydrolysing)